MPSFRMRAGLASAASALATAGLIAVMTPASAAPSEPATSVVMGTATLALPGAAISGRPPSWHPGSLSVAPRKWQGSCGPAKAAWTVTNKTKSTQVLRYASGSSKQKWLGRLAAGKRGYVCLSGPARTKVRYFIRGSRSVLHVTLK